MLFRSVQGLVIIVLDGLSSNGAMVVKKMMYIKSATTSGEQFTLIIVIWIHVRSQVLDRQIILVNADRRLFIVRLSGSSHGIPHIWDLSSLNV